MTKIEFFKKIATFGGFLLFLYVFEFEHILDNAMDFFEARFPVAYAVFLLLFPMTLACVLLGLLVYYGGQSAKAFREGMREGRRKKF